MIVAELIPRLTTYAWLEEATFAMLGSWVRSTTEPEVKLLFAEQSHRHAWHASLWRKAMPAVPHDAVEIDPGLRAFVDLLTSVTDVSRRLTGTYRVLAPVRVDGYRALQSSLAPASDGPIDRAITLIVADQARDLASGRALLGGHADAAWEQELRERWPGT